LSFADATKVERVGPGHYRATAIEGWDILGVTNGGYLLATAARAMGEETEGRKIASISGRYIAPTRAGNIEVTVEGLKQGRTVSNLRSTMTDGDRTLMVAEASFVDPRSARAELNRTYGKPPVLPPREECVRILPAEDGPFPPPVTAKVEIYLHPDHSKFGARSADLMPEVVGWMRLPDGELLDDYGIVFASDAFPPAIFGSDFPIGWTPTIDLSVQVRDPGPHEWLVCRFYSRYITGGWMEEDGEIWDTAGNLVGLSRQTALVNNG
jgi:acyl-CoA thioesterase